MDKQIYDLIIIGAGPAGVTSSIYAARSGMKTLVINSSEIKVNRHFEVSNLYGLVKPIDYAKLVEQGITQAKSFGVNIIDDACYEFYKEEDIFTCITKKDKYYAKTVVLATGIHYQKLPIDNFDDYVGLGIHYCGMCDAFIYRDKKVALFGYGKYLTHEYEYLKAVCKDITIYLLDDTSNGDLNNYSFDHPVFKNAKITQIHGSDKLNALTINGETISYDALFVALGSPNSHNLATKAGVIVESQKILVDNNYETNIKGVFAIGDAIGGKTQIVKASFEGMSVIDSIKVALNK